MVSISRHTRYFHFLIFLLTGQFSQTQSTINEVEDLKEDIFSFHESVDIHTDVYL